MHEMTAYDEAIDEGTHKAHMHALMTLGRKLFGPPDAKTEASVRRIKDTERTQRMLDAILEVKSWKALLAIK